LRGARLGGAATEGTAFFREAIAGFAFAELPRIAFDCFVAFDGPDLAFVETFLAVFAWVFLAGPLWAAAFLGFATALDFGADVIRPGL
jgi:hypothetical protein